MLLSRGAEQSYGRPMPDRTTLTSVRNAARVLRAFSRAGQELGITELSRQLGLGKSTVHRLVTTLTAERLLERGSTPGRYRLGLVLYELGSNVTEHVDLHQAALPVIATLRHETGEMVHVAVLDELGQDPAGRAAAGRAEPAAGGLATGGPDAVDDHRQEPAAGRAGRGGRARLGAEPGGRTPRHRLGGRADPRPGRQGHGLGQRRRRQRPDARDDAPGHHAGGRVRSRHLPPAWL